MNYEQSLICKFLIEPSSLLVCDLKPEEFSQEQHRQIYRAIETLNNRGEVVDLFTVGEYLQADTNQNWLPILIEIQKGMPATSVERYVQFVRKQHQAGNAIRIAEELIEKAMTDGSIDSAIGDLMNLAQTQTKFEFTGNEALKLAVEDLEKAYNGENIGHMTGLTDLDEKLGGLHDSDLVVVGARPAMGKTAFALNLGAGLLANGVPIGIFSGEQPASQLTQRLISMGGSVPVSRMRSGKILDSEWPKVTAGVQKFKDQNFYIFDKSAPTISEIIRQTRQWVHAHGVKVIFIDYLQRLKVDSSRKRHEAIGEATRLLKELARDLNICVVALAQVNRNVESRQDKRPSMGDLKDSGEIEQEADQIMMLYRDEVYNPETIHKGTAEIILDKNRHGPTGYINTIWRGEFLRFETIGRVA